MKYPMDFFRDPEGKWCKETMSMQGAQTFQAWWLREDGEQIGVDLLCLQFDLDKYPEAPDEPMWFWGMSDSNVVHGPFEFPHCAEYDATGIWPRKMMWPS